METRTRALTRDVTDINREFSINPLVLDDCRATVHGEGDGMAVNDRHGCYRFDLANRCFSIVKSVQQMFLSSTKHVDRGSR